VSNLWLEKTECLEDDIITLLSETIRDKRKSLSHRLKAAEMVLSRRVPTLKCVELDLKTPTNFIFISAQELASKKLLEEKLPENELLFLPENV